MRKVFLPLLSFLLGALVIIVALIIYGSIVTERSNSPRGTGDPGILGSTPPSGKPGTLPVQYARAWEALNAGRTREAQDAFLEILSADPQDQHAMQGLVAARRKMIGDDPQELRRQAAAYRDAIIRGADTGDHYTRAAMYVLIAASEQAAEEIEARGNPAPPVLSETPPKPADLPRLPSPKDKVAPSAKRAPLASHAAKPITPPTPALPAPHATPAPQASPPPPPAPQASPPPPAPAPQAPPPPPAPAPQAPPPAPSVGDRLYMVRISPVSDRDRASAIAEELAGKGLSPAKVSVRTGPLFRVVSEPLPRGVAESLAISLAGRGFHSRVEAIGGETTHLLFGIFASQEEADALSRRINAQGYDAWVVREGTAYTLELGPYPQTAFEAISGIIKSRAPEATVVMNPIPPSPTPAPAPQAPSPAPAPQAPPAPPAPAPRAPSPPPSAGNRLYMVWVNPVSDRDRASAITKELAGKGFAPAKVNIQPGSVFRVVSEPLPRSQAESLAAVLAGRGFRSQVEALSGDTTHLLFGTFTSQEEADTLSKRINAQGYDAWVMREGFAYTLELGPYPQSSIEAITGIIKSSVPDAVVTAVLASPAPPAAAPQPPPASAVPAPEDPHQPQSEGGKGKR